MTDESPIEEDEKPFDIMDVLRYAKQQLGVSIVARRDIIKPNYYEIFIQFSTMCMLNDLYTLEEAKDWVDRRLLKFNQRNIWDALQLIKKEKQE